MNNFVNERPEGAKSLCRGYTGCDPDSNPQDAVLKKLLIIFFSTFFFLTF